jgi:predicted nucleic acid-binding protein
MLVDTTVWVDHLRRGDEVLAFVEVNRLMGRGLGWVDVNLLVSADAAGEKLLTRDRRLKGAAESLGLA